jgi:hypothetical protein
VKLFFFKVSGISITLFFFALHISETNPLIDSLSFYILRQQR